MEPGKIIDQLAHEVIGGAIEAHKFLGPGFLESVYEEALYREPEMKRMPFSRQLPANIRYKEKVVGESRLDLLVGGELIVELKAVDHLLPIHHAQVISYLKMMGKPLGFLINFNVPALRAGIKRVILSS